MRIRIPFQFQFPLAALAVLCSVSAAADGPVIARKPHVDRFGDPLPKGAIARLEQAKDIKDGRFISDGRYFVSGSTLWDTATGKKLRSMKKVTAFITPKGKPLCIPWRKRRGFPGFHAIDLRTGRMCYEFRLREPGFWHLYSVQPSSRSAMLLAIFRSDDFLKTRVTTHNAETGKLMSVLAAAGSVTNAKLAISGRHRKVVAALNWPRIRIWDAATGKIIRRITLSRKAFPVGIQDFSISDNGAVLFGLSLNRHPADIGIWNVASGRIVFTSQLGSPVPEMRTALSPSGTHFAEFHESRKSRRQAPRVRIWNLLAKPTSVTYRAPLPFSDEMQFSRDGALFTTGNSELFDLRRMRPANLSVKGILPHPFGSWTMVSLPSNALGFFLVRNDRQIALIETCSGTPFYRTPVLLGPEMIDRRLTPSRKPVLRISIFNTSANGNLAAVQLSDSRVFVYRTAPRDLSVLKSRAQLEAVWKRLGDPRATVGRKAALELARLPESRLMSFLTTKLKPRSIDDTKIKSLIQKLGSKDFKTRRQADATLRSIGPIIESHLESSYGRSSDPEAKQRLRSILHSFGPYLALSNDRRRVRCVVVLTGIRTKSAHRLLQLLALGPVDAPETIAARAAIVTRSLR